jgi:Satellite tobacco necrosis virus coat protein.
MAPKRKMAFGPMAGGFKKYKAPALRRRKAFIKGPVRPVKELNYVNVQSNVNTVTVGGQSGGPNGGGILLNGIAEGDDNTDRNGRKAKMVSVDCTTNFDGTVVGIATTYRSMLVWDNDTQGAAPAISALLTNLATNWLNAPINVDNENRFTILSDKRVSLSTGSSTIFIQIYSTFLT